MVFFFSIYPEGAGGLQRKQALEIVKHNIFWIADREKDILENLFEITNKKSRKLQQA